jgi:hypothetical protein
MVKIQSDNRRRVAVAEGEDWGMRVRERIDVDLGDKVQMCNQ